MAARLGRHGGRSLRRTPTGVRAGHRVPGPRPDQLSFVGCDDLYQRGDEPLRPTIDRGPGEAPLGTRSLGFDLAGGNAIGALFTVGSVLTTSPPAWP